MRDCKTGWGGKKLTDARINKLIGSIKILSEMHDYRLILRKFVGWLRSEHGYPNGYPDREELIRILSIVKYPTEVGKIRVIRPDKLKPAEEIPTQAEMQYLSDAAINPPDKAFFEMAKEVTMHDKTLRHLCGSILRKLQKRSCSLRPSWLEGNDQADCGKTQQAG